jgi:hypothetical protein
MGVAVERVTAALRAAGSHQLREGGDWTCPAHEDSTPSLSVSNGDGSVLVHCHANWGCTTEAILERIGLRMADLYDEPTTGKYSKQVVANYNYVDEAGELLFQVVRYDPKDFRQRQPDGRGGWVFNTKGVRRVLYRLPEVLQTAMAGGEIFIVEGEKDVHALERLGAVATCNAGGAGKWREEYTQSLVGAGLVRVVADNDEPGRDHARQVAASLTKSGISVKVLHAPAGKDVAEHLGMGRRIDDLEPLELHLTSTRSRSDDTRDLVGHRTLRVRRASEIKPRPVQWLWRDRIALGTLALLGGREGIGKSTVSYHLVAQITRGTLPGRHEGKPRTVIVAATEDSWEHTIVPRLMAAGADLDLVLQVGVMTSDGLETQLTLPADLVALERLAVDEGVALILLDPLLSRLDVNLDTHKDAEVRRALEPLVALADRTDAAVLGLIHVNKSSSADPLTLLMGSRAFAAVSRAVIFVVSDPESDLKFLGQPKNNLGRTDLPTLTYRIEQTQVAETEEGAVLTGRVVWEGEDNRTIRDVLGASVEGAETRTATKDAADWLRDYLQHVGGECDSAKIKDAAKAAGHTIAALQRGRTATGVQTRSAGFPCRTYWRLAGNAPVLVVSSAGETATTATTQTSGQTGGVQRVQLLQSSQLSQSPGTGATTGEARPLQERVPTGSDLF